MSTPAKPMYAFARCDKLYTMAELEGAQLHGDRDETARFEVRPGTTPDKDQIRWTRGAGSDVFDVLAGWRTAKGSARERKNAPICLHLIIGVSPGWVTQSGDLHDRQNPANIALLQAAQNYVESRIGPVAAVRLDLDEVGGGEVDVFCVPTSCRQRRRKKDGNRSEEGILEISINKAFTELRRQTKERADYSALQSAWADYAKEHLDRKLVRGQRKYMTGRRHLETPEYKALMAEIEALEARARLAKAEIDALDGERQRIAELREALDNRQDAITARELHYRERIDNEIDGQIRAIANAWVRRAEGQELTPDNEAAMNAPLAVGASTALVKALTDVETVQHDQEKRAEAILLEEQRVAQLRFAQREQERALDAREHRIREHEEKVQADRVELQDRANSLSSRARKLKEDELALEIAQERAESIAEQARSLRDRLLMALRAIARQWLGKPDPDDERLLAHPELADLMVGASEVSSEFTRQRQKLEADTSRLSERFIGVDIAESALDRRENWLDDLEARIKSRQIELERNEAALADREEKHAVQIDELKKTQEAQQLARSTHDKQVAVTLAKFGRAGSAIGRYVLKSATEDDRRALSDPLFSSIIPALNQAKNELDRKRSEEREAINLLTRQRIELEKQKSALQSETGNVQIEFDKVLSDNALATVRYQQLKVVLSKLENEQLSKQEALNSVIDKLKKAEHRLRQVDDLVEKNAKQAHAVEKWLEDNKVGLERFLKRSDPESSNLANMPITKVIEDARRQKSALDRRKQDQGPSIG